MVQKPKQLPIAQSVLITGVLKFETFNYQSPGLDEVLQLKRVIYRN